MPLVKPAAPPGVMSQASQVQARGAWYAMNRCRWRTGLLEKMGGWRRLIDEALPSIVRRMHAWLDLDNRKNLLIATDLGVHLKVQDTTYALGRQIGMPAGYVPLLGPIGETTKFSVANAATEVIVETHAVVAPGMTFLVRLAISIGGRIIAAGTFLTVKNLVPGTGFSFDMPMPALYAEANTYGVALLTNDIVNGFTVTFRAHGLGVGSQFRLAQQTVLAAGTYGPWDQVLFSAPAGTVFTVATVPDADHFTFAMGAFGRGDGTGGTSHQVYIGSWIGNPTTGEPVVVIFIGTVIGVPVARPLGNPQKNAWFLGNLGQDGLALASGGPLEVYKPPIESGPFLSPVPVGSPANVPQRSNGMLVAMPQAQVILWGTEAIVGSGVVDPLLIRFSDIGSYDKYLATVSNQAGSYRLSRGSRIMGAIQAPQATLIITDTDLWQMSYIGPPLVYGFTIMGSGCGLVAPHAIGTLGRQTIWQGQKNFWSFDTGVQPVMCTVWDYIFNDVDPVNINKCHAAPNSTTNELAFYFPSKSVVIDVDDNLLRSSQAFSDPGAWVLGDVLVAHFVLFTSRYVYEPQYAKLAWFDDAGIPPVAWRDRDVQGEISSELIFAPDGSGTAFNLTEGPGNGLHQISQSIEKAGERITYTLSVYAHKSSTRNLTLRAMANQDGVYATFNVVTGNVLAASVYSPRFSLINAKVVTDELATGTDTPAGNGWRRYLLTFTSNDDSDLTVFFNVTNGTNISYLGEPPKGVLIWGAQLVEGGEPLDYQQTGEVQRQNETRRYVKVNSAEGMAWDSGELDRTAWLDESVWGMPLGGDMDNLIQQHEIGFDADGKPMENVFAETGFTELGDGTMVMLIDECHPDMKWFGLNGGVDISLRAANYPQGPKHLYGPFPITPGTQWFDPRVRARYVAVRYDWLPKLGFSARVGATTFHVKPAGRLP